MSTNDNETIERILKSMKSPECHQIMAIALDQFAKQLSALSLFMGQNNSIIENALMKEGKDVMPEYLAILEHLEKMELAIARNQDFIKDSANLSASYFYLSL